MITNSLFGGGAENSAFLMYEKLLSRGVNIKLCIINNDSTDDVPKAVFALSRKWKSGALSTYRCFKDFKSIVKTESPNILVAHCELPELFCAFIKSRHIDIICVEHTSRPWFGRKALGIFVRLILRVKHAKWITVSSPPKKIWISAASPKLIANPVETPVRYSASDSNAQVVFVGRLRKEKRPEWAIKAALKNHLQIALYGIGEEFGLLSTKYSSQSTSVIFEGFKKNPWESIKSDSLLIVPSEFEGDGLVVVECILRDNPLLIFDNDDLRRFNLPERNYFKSEIDLIEKVALAKTDGFSSLRPPKTIADALRHERDIDFIANQWEEILK